MRSRMKTDGEDGEAQKEEETYAWEDDEEKKKEWN